MALVSTEELLSLKLVIGMPVDPEASPIALWVATRYENATHPFYPTPEQRNIAEKLSNRL